MWETWVRSLGWVDPLEEGMATHSNILAWRIPWTEELVGYSPRGCKYLDMTEGLALTHAYILFKKNISGTQYYKESDL